MKLNSFFKLITLTLVIFTFLSCEKDGSKNIDYTAAKKQFVIDYPNYDLSKVNWTEERGYQVARYGTLTKAATTPSITAWYTVAGDNADRKMDSENFGTAVPDKIKAAFENDTVYSNTKLWRIDEIELENRYDDDDTVSEQVYEMELESVTTTNLEAELFFSATTGELLFSKESLDADDDDDADDKFVINQELIDAVLKAFPDGNIHILDAEVDDNQIEVEAIDTVKKWEIELLFSMTYEFLGSEKEYATTYGELSADFSAINAWFTTKKDTYPAPPPATEVEITEGTFEDEDEDDVKYSYKYEVEIEYEEGEFEYEFEFLLDANYKIVGTPEAEKDDK